jgi:endonuclease III
MAKAENDLVAELLAACEQLEERYGRRKLLKHADFIEALVFQILELGVKEATARQTLERLRAEYVDWNDMRVATVREIEDILGAKYYRCREKSEDIKHLLADLYTAFRRMDIQDLLTADGIATLRALPDTTNIRRDMVDRALLLVLELKVFPCDEDQFKLLKFLGGVPKHLAYQVGVRKIEESLDPEQMLRLSRVLREHVHVYTTAGEDEPQDVSFGLKKDKPDTKSAKKPTGSVKKDAEAVRREARLKAEAARREAAARSAKATTKVRDDDEDDDGADDEDDEYQPATARHEATVKDKSTTRREAKPATAAKGKPATAAAKKGTATSGKGTAQASKGTAATGKGTAASGKGTAQAKKGTAQAKKK